MHNLKNVAATLSLLLTIPAGAVDLAGLYRMAIESDPRYLQTRFDRAAANESVDQAMAQLLPNVSFNGSVARNQTESTLPSFGGTVNNSYEYVGSNLSLTVRQPIYRPYNFALLQQSKSQLQGAEAAYSKAQQDFILRLCGSYFDVLLAEDAVRLAGTQVGAYREQVRAATMSFAAGQGTRTDIDDSVARLDIALASEIEANNNLSQSKNVVRSFVNQPVDAFSPLLLDPILLVSKRDYQLPYLLAKAATGNYEVQAASAALASSRLELEKASAGHQPTLDVTVSRSKSNNANDVSINQQYLTTSAGIQFNIPIYTGGYTSSLERQAVAMLAKSEQQLEYVRRQVVVDVEREFNTIQNLVSKAKALRAAIVSAQQAVVSNSKSVQAGTRSRIDVINSEQQLNGLRRDRGLAEYQLMMAVLRLDALTGDLDESDVTQVNGLLAVAQ